MSRNRIKLSLGRFADRALRLSKDAAAVYEMLLPSETKYAEALQQIHDGALELYYAAQEGQEA